KAGVVSPPSGQSTASAGRGAGGIGREIPPFSFRSHKEIHMKTENRSMPADRGRGPGGPGLRWGRSAVLGTIAALGIAAPGRADGLVIPAPEITAAPGSSGAFLVLLTDTDPAGSTPYKVAGDSFELTLNGPAGISFTDVTTATEVAPYN